MELSVLERQRALLQRISKDHFDMDSAFDHLWHPQVNDQQRRSCSAASALPIPKPDWQCNSSFANPNKRKAELDIEYETRDKSIHNEEETAAEEKSDITTKTERETSANAESKGSLKDSESQKRDYIHVRARRGQATDSHSLAERARREKISKKMKSLQDLVPGCNRVTGKAGMLDEIINYVQSLHKQVEFLSMKLAAINPQPDFSIDNLLAKQIPTYITSLPAAAELEATNTACFRYNSMQLAMEQSHLISSQKAGTSSLLIPEMFLDSSCISQLQQLSGLESDWQNLFSAGFP